MTDGWFNRISTRSLSRLFPAILLALLVATGFSLSYMQAQSELAADRAAVRMAAASRTESVMALSRSRSEALRAVLAGATEPARAAAERRLAAVTRQWQAATEALRAPKEGSADALLVDETLAAASRVVDAQADVLLALSRNDVAAAQRTYVEREVESESALQASLARLTDSHGRVSAAIVTEVAERGRRLFLLLAAAVALVIAGSGIAGYALIRRANRQEADLHRERSLSGLTLQAINDGVLTVDAEGRIEFMNRVAEALTGWRSEDARQRPLAEVYALLDERTRELHCFEPWRASAPLQKRPEGRQEGDAALRLATRDGRELSIRHSFSQVVDLEGVSSGALVVFRDDTSLRTLAHQLSWQASHDAFTGLANRREFERALGELLASAAAGHKAHALLCIELDAFKAVDGSGAAPAGDELLRQVATTMRAQMRSSDVLARLGGDQFGVLLESCPPEQAVRVANTLRDAVNALVLDWQGRSFTVAASIGLLQIDAGSGSVAEVIGAADALCDEAKAAGHEKVQVYRPDHETGQRRSSDARIVTQISEALEQGRFVLHAQTVSPLRAQLAGSDHREVLVRMLDANGNLLPPSIFLPAAERYELLSSIDRWVLRTLAGHLAERQSRDDGGASRPLRHSVNVSSASLQAPEFRAFVRGLIDSHRLPQGQLCLELTEVGAMSDLTRIADAMQELRVAGCSFALDDFGIGLSSFSYLRYLPIDYLKIEAGFVRGMNDDPMDCAIVDSIARIGHVLGIHTVAQGVDDVDTAERLRAMGVDYAQGNQYGAPRLLAEDVARPRLDRATPMMARPLAPRPFALGSSSAGQGGR